MKILYGLAGEGFGHSSRALVVGDYLEKKGHEVKILTYGQAIDVLKDRFDVFEVEGLHLIFEESVLKKRQTVKYNAENFPKNLKNWKKFHELMKEFDPDVCVSDMEPIVPVLRYWHNKPLICFDNQHRLTNLEIDIPSEYLSSYVLAKGAVDTFVRRADYFIVTSFVDVPIRNKDKENTIIVPPIIREDVRNVSSTIGDKILVYLTKKDESVIDILKGMREDFVVYGYNVNDVDGNLEYKVRDTFLDDLAACNGVIATAGFTLMSESLYLNKPYLAVPLVGQFEQTLNALFLQNAGFGEFTENLSEKDIAHFLYRMEDYRNKLKEFDPDYSRLFRAWDEVLGKVGG